MGNLNCVTIKHGDSVKDWIRREAKSGKKKGNIDDVIAEVIKKEKRKEKCKNKKDKREKLKVEAEAPHQKDTNTTGGRNDDFEEEEVTPRYEDDCFEEEDLVFECDGHESDINESPNDETDEQRPQTPLPMDHIKLNTDEGENKNSANESTISYDYISFENPTSPLRSQEALEENEPQELDSAYMQIVNTDSHIDVDRLTQCYVKIMMQLGISDKPLPREIQRIKEDPYSFIPAVRDIPSDEKRGSIEELKWSRHMQRIQLDKERQERHLRYQENLRSNYFGGVVLKEVSNDVCEGSRYSKYVSQSSRSFENTTTADNRVNGCNLLRRQKSLLNLSGRNQ